MSDRMAIEQFRGDYYFLSSMYPSKPGLETPDGVIVPTAEHYYQAAKFIDADDRGVILSARDGFKAKQLADGLIERGAEIREDWEELRIPVMQDAVHEKFSRNGRIAYLLAQTGEEELIEGNTRGDTFWGVAMPERVGENHLGIILMEEREALQAEIPTRKK